MIISPTSLSFFFSYVCLIAFWSLHWIAACSILFVTKTFPWACIRCMWVTCVLSIVVFIFLGSAGHFALGFISHVYCCPPPLFGTLTSVVCADATTLRLHISAWIAIIWSSWCLNFVVKFLLFVVSLVKAAFLDSVADAKLIDVYSLFPCFALLVMP